jgi:hypothetical protein
MGKRYYQEGHIEKVLEKVEVFSTQILNSPGFTGLDLSG